jgi:para-nitrobenzyl esterase
VVAAALAATAALAAPSLAAAHDGHGSSGHGGNGHGSAAVVQTDKGAVRGLVKPYVREFRGIPYAAAPSGSRRWAEPQPVARWQGVRDASAYPANCPQDASGDPGFEQQSTNEDCLGLNVVTPKSAPRDAPVFVFIHGGGYRVGHATFETMQRFVQKTGAVAVTMNYRLGVLGFLDVRKFGDGAGNFGVLDQQASLRWVQRNIDRFGGDPRNVTIAGQSAGAGSVCAQLASPGARGLFDAAIIESGGNSCNATRTKEVAQQEGSTFATALGCAPDRSRSCSLPRAASESAADPRSTATCCPVRCRSCSRRAASTASR